MAATTPPVIDDLPLPPDPNDRATFNARAYPWSLAQQTLATQVNAATQNVYNNAADAAASAVAANQSKIDAGLAKADAEQARDDAEGHAQNAANAAYTVASQWVANAAYTPNQIVWLNSSSGDLYRCIASVSGATQPSLDAAHWVFIGPPDGSLPASTSYTYTSGRVTKITEDSVDTTISYNLDGTVDEVVYPHAGKTRTETYSYSSGVLTGMTASEA